MLFCREVTFDWSGKHSLSAGVGLKNRSGTHGGKGESTAHVASVRAPCSPYGACTWHADRCLRSSNAMPGARLSPCFACFSHVARYLAKDLGAAGVDIDYEEMWHADCKFAKHFWVVLGIG